MRFPNPFTALKALGRVISALFRKKPVFVSAEVAENRIQTCENCQFFDSGVRQCEICSCFPDTKAFLATENCPLDFWGKL